MAAATSRVPSEFGGANVHTQLRETSRDAESEPTRTDPFDGSGLTDER